MAQRHKNWADTIPLFEARVERLAQLGDESALISMCGRAASICDEQLERAADAMRWLERAWGSDSSGAHRDAVDERARELASTHSATPSTTSSATTCISSDAIAAVPKAVSPKLKTNGCAPPTNGGITAAKKIADISSVCSGRVSAQKQRR